ncbi:MAG: tRNA 2-thiouridine(34) synthase MnmA [candidate division WOR-3 bacterium]
MRVLAAMSGGVDSAVAAALLKEQGWDVVGVTMLLHENDEGRLRPDGRGCCGSQAVRDARRVAARLAIPHYVWDLRREFEAAVIQDFCHEYAQGRTPNPCIRCNDRVKFGVMLERGRQLGATHIATGHHARVEQIGGRWYLRAGNDKDKDQSYFLYTMAQEQMGQVLMPVGNLTKSEVRDIARRYRLPVAQKPESQEVCFVPEGDHVSFLKKRQPELFRPGPVLDMKGQVLGRHQGAVGFTVGQRKGLGLAFGERMYVARVDVAANAVVLGTGREVRGRVVEAADARWTSGREPESPIRVHAKVRYRSTGGSALVEPLPDRRCRVTFDKPQWAPTPGQAVVFWLGDSVLGGGTIESWRRE